METASQQQESCKRNGRDKEGTAGKQRSRESVQGGLLEGLASNFQQVDLDIESVRGTGQRGQLTILSSAQLPRSPDNLTPHSFPEGLQHRLARQRGFATTAPCSCLLLVLLAQLFPPSKTTATVYIQLLAHKRLCQGDVNTRHPPCLVAFRLSLQRNKAKRLDETLPVLAHKTDR